MSHKFFRAWIICSWIVSRTLFHSWIIKLKISSSYLHCICFLTDSSFVFLEHLVSSLMWHVDYWHQTGKVYRMGLLAMYGIHPVSVNLASSDQGCTIRFMWMNDMNISVDCRTDIKQMALFLPLLITPCSPYRKVRGRYICSYTITIHFSVYLLFLVKIYFK